MLVALPAHEERLGSVQTSWYEATPGAVVIRVEGGTAEDREFARQHLDLDLALHGYEPYVYDVEDPPIDGKTAGIHEGAWADVAAKAKRLLDSNQVQLLRNGFNYIVGHVTGDHGDYDTEISRDDPGSRAITGWQCQCQWDQYAWQRTRQWKKYEGRPCSHVLALYWKSLGTPLDDMDQLTPEQQATLRGQAMPPPAPAVPEHPDDPAIDPANPEGIDKPAPVPSDLPRSFSPDGEVIQGDQLGLGLGGPPRAPQAPTGPAAPPEGPAPSGVLPPFPGEQMQMEYAGPGTTPGGGVAPIGVAVSVPGARPTTPQNPLNQPGTLSKIVTGDVQFNPQQVVKLKNDVMGTAEGPVKGQYGDGSYRDVPAGTLGEVREQQGPWVDCIFPIDDAGAHEPFHVHCFVDATDIEPASETNAFIRRRT